MVAYKFQPSCTKGPWILTPQFCFYSFLLYPFVAQFLAYLVCHAPSADIAVEELATKSQEVSEIVFFLLGAMTIVEIIDAHQGFKLVTDNITTRKPRSLLWVVGFGYSIHYLLVLLFFSERCWLKIFVACPCLNSKYWIFCNINNFGVPLY